MTDELMFSGDAENKTASHKPDVEPYKILVVDDDEEIHVITKMALGEFRLDEKPLEFYSAYSAAEAKEILKQENDFALALIDVVMEHDSAGLELAHWIREEHKNKLIRIVLRTGQPGQAPEEEVIARYDIDDYKEKTELTYRKLITLMYSSLRAFRDLSSIERYKASLENIIQASAQLFSVNSVQQLSQAILEQLVALLTHAENAAYCKLEGYTATGQENQPLSIIAATQEYQTLIGEIWAEAESQEVFQRLVQEAAPVSFEIHDRAYYGLYHTRDDNLYLLYIRGIRDLSDTDQHLLTLFMNNTAIAFEQNQLSAAR